ncbi:MAG: hypothetical protein ABGW56_03165 [Flavobacteriaceae bacterium]
MGEDLNPAYLVELIYRDFAESGRLYEVSMSVGKAYWDEEAEDFEEFQRDDYISEQMFLDGKEITLDKFNELGGFDATNESHWYWERYFKTEEEAKKFANDLTAQVKRGDWT